MSARRFWTRADDRQLRSLYPHQPTEDVAKAIGRSLAATYGRAGTLRLHKSAAYLASPAAHRLDGVKGLGTRFQAGHATWNKGTHWTAGGRSALTRFKKGSRSVRWPVEDYPIGALRINADGGLDMKVREGLRAWDCMARFVWASERGPIPPGMVIRYRNGDTHDTRLQNLELITRAEHLRRNWHDRYPLALRQIVQLRGALQRQINKREGKREQHDQRPA